MTGLLLLCTVAAVVPWVKADGACYVGFRSIVHALSTVDALLSLAAVAKLPGYVRPVYRTAAPAASDVGGTAPRTGGEANGTRADKILLRAARHPTVERVLEGGFVPNDVELR